MYVPRPRSICPRVFHFPANVFSLAVKMEFDAVQLDLHLGINPTGRSETTEASLHRIAPKVDHPHQQREPCVYLDRHNKLLLWYLPDFLDERMRVRSSAL